MFYWGLAPIAFLGMIGSMIWGPQILHSETKGTPAYIYFMVLGPISIILSLGFYVFHHLIPDIAPLIPRKLIGFGNKKSEEEWLVFVRKSKLIAKRKYEVLEEHEKQMAEPEA